MTPSATLARGGREVIYTRDDIVQALVDYAELYGDEFPTTAFNPSLSKWRARPEYRERYLAGNPKTGRPWPSLNTIKKTFGSWNAAREAAGLSTNRPGPRKGTHPRAQGTAEPIRGVSDAVRTVYVEKSDEQTLKRLTRAERDRDNARARVARLEEKLANRKEKSNTQTKTITKTKVVKERVRVEDTRALKRAETKLARAEQLVSELEAQVKSAEKASKEAREAATRIASRLERSEATVSELRDDRRQLRARVDKLEDKLTVAERELSELRARKPVVVTEEAPEAAVVEAAERAAHEAELRAAKAEREYAELAVAVKGTDRKLTPAELEELRVKNGLAGPAIVTQAVAGYVKATKRGTKTELYAALSKLASAAISYRDRL